MHPLGGLARKATLLDRARGEADAVLVVDAGDDVMPPAPRVPDLKPPDAGELDRRARLLFQSLTRMGLHAWTPGERDIDMGVPQLTKILRQYKVPAVSANLTDKRGKRLFEASRIVDARGIKVGFFGVTAALPEDKALWERAGVIAQDPTEAARAAVAALRSRGAKIVVGLLHVGPIADSKALVKKVPGIDFAVLGHSQLNLEIPDEEGDTRLLEAMVMGKEVGRLDLHAIDGVTTKFGDRGQRSQLIATRADHQRQIDDVRKRASEDSSGKLKEYYEGRIKGLETSIERESKLIDMLPANVKGSWMENRILPLDSAIVDHPGVAMLVSEYNAESGKRAAAGKPVGIGWPGHPSGGHPASHDIKPEEPLRYAGVVSCGTCHAQAVQFWKTTKHAHALASLRNKARDQDPTCIGCHVTGYARPGGTRDLALAAGRLKDVGCEACHGPGADHIVASSKKTTIARKVGAEVCLGCHTKDQTNGDFDYPTFLKAILGPGHGG